MASELLAAAVSYATRGWPVFPCEPCGKRPLGRLAPHGCKDATTSWHQVCRWWLEEPAANIGVATGVCFDVLDVDGAEGEAALAEARGGQPAERGPSVRTGGGGRHVYVTPTGLGNRAGFIAHCDWRGKGGYVVSPPSLHESGRRYEWLSEPVLLEPAPEWIQERLVRRPLPYQAAKLFTPPSAYIRRALEAECGRVALATEGCRNDQLNGSAYALGQLVGGGALDQEEAHKALLLAAVRAGLDEREAVATITSGLQGGLSRPRRVDEPKGQPIRRRRIGPTPAVPG